MAGYNLSNKNTYRLMQGRLGIYDKKPYDPSKNNVEGVDSQSTIMRFNGGNKQQERMVLSKRRSLDRVVWNSYQAAEVVRNDAEYKKPIRALINPDKLRQDYDDKIISVGYEYGFKTGTVFEWLGTNTYWIVYLQDLTELAYFRGNIRRCNYEIAWEDEDGYHSTYAAIRGPSETKIDSSYKHGVNIDSPNYSLNILIPNSEEALKHFHRYTKFYLKNDTQNICWRVEATNWISMPGVLEINAVEFYANKIEDDIENGIVGGLIVKPSNPNTEEIEETIIGETFIEIKTEYEYEFNGGLQSEWYVDKKYPVALLVDNYEPRKVKLKWLSTYSGQFELMYGDYKKTIIVQSLF